MLKIFEQQKSYMGWENLPPNHLTSLTQLWSTWSADFLEELVVNTISLNLKPVGKTV